MVDLFSTKRPPNTEAVGQIKQWVYELFQVSTDTAVTVMELRCQEDDCPDVETVIGILAGPGLSRKHTLNMPMNEVTRDDVRNLAARGRHG